MTGIVRTAMEMYRMGERSGGMALNEPNIETKVAEEKISLCD
jgi:hypothetical protein